MVEAGFQNFAAGLILAAVAEELFPLMAQVPGGVGASGEAIGFAAGLIIVYGTEVFIEKCVGSDALVDLDNDTNSSRVGIEWDYLPLPLASKALSNKEHRNHIIDHLKEMVTSMELIGSASEEVLSINSSSYLEESKLTEQIDEKVYTKEFCITNLI